MDTLLIIDGNSIFNRAYYGLGAVGNLKTTSGIPTQALYGFLNIFFKNMDEEKPTHVVIAFDRKEKTFRHEMFDQYKAERKGMPDDLAVQFPYLKQILQAMRVRTIDKPGFEADDLIGAVAKLGNTSGYEVVILTGDRDVYQLVSNKTRVKIPTVKKGASVTEHFDQKAIKQRFGIEPEQFVDVKALMGDASDGIPGIRGVGEKTALQLIAQYQSLDGVYENLDHIKRKALKQKLEEEKEQAYLSYQLAKIDTNLDHGLQMEDLSVQPVDQIALYELFEQLEFFSLIQKMNLSRINPQKSSTHQPERTIFTLKTADELSKWLSDVEEVAIYFECKREHHPFLSLSMVCLDKKDSCVYVDMEKTQEQKAITDILKDLSCGNIRIDTYDLKAWYHALECPDITFDDRFFDILIAAYVLDPATRKNDPLEIAAKYGVNVQVVSDESNSEDQKSILAAAKAHAILLSKKKMMNLIDERGQRALFYDVEIPLIQVLADMEHEGFYINRDELVAYANELEERIKEPVQSIYDLAGHTFNINSPKQLGSVLFEELGLPPVKKTKTGYSTNVDVLEKLKGRHEIIEHIFTYRRLTKIKSTYADALQELIHSKTGRVHTILRQDVTATGRISSTDPNLQNIPVRTTEGKRMRKVFEAKDDHMLVDADYSQIELRVLAHMANDQAMIEAFANNADIHRTTAAKVFGMKEEDVTEAQRTKAKAVNFGIVYGIGAYSLSQDLDTSVSDAEMLIQSYLKNYPGVDTFMKEAVQLAKEHGYAKTLLNRRRYIDELKSASKQVRSFGERVAMNAPIQGSAADIIKLAMVHVHRAIRKNHLKARMILQVHDELILEAPADEVEQVKKMVKDSMEKAMSLKVALLAEVKSGKSWFDAK